MAHLQIIDSAELLDLSGAQWRHRTEQTSAYNSTVLACLPGGVEANSTFSNQPWLRVTFTGRELTLVGTLRPHMRINYTLTSQGQVADEDVVEMREAVLSGVTRDLGLYRKQGVSLFTFLDAHLLLPQDVTHTLTLYPYGSEEFSLDYVTFRPPVSGVNRDTPRTFLVDDARPGGGVELSSQSDGTTQWDIVYPMLEYEPDEEKTELTDSEKDLLDFIPVGPWGWVSTNVTGSTLQYSFDGDFIAVHGPIYTPSNISTTGAMLRVECTILHPDNDDPVKSEDITLMQVEPSTEPGIEDSTTRRWEQKQLFKITVPEENRTSSKWVLKVKVLEVSEGMTFNVDYLTFGTSLRQLQADHTPTTDNNAPPDTSGSKIDGKFVGSIVGGVVGVGIVITIIILLWRKEVRKASARKLRARMGTSAPNQDDANASSPQQPMTHERGWEDPAIGSAPPPWSPPGIADGPTSAVHRDPERGSSPPPSPLPLTVPRMASLTSLRTDTTGRGLESDQTAMAAAREVEREEKPQRELEGQDSRSRTAVACEIHEEIPPPYVGEE